MKLFTNENNTNTIKIVIASKFSQKSIDICQNPSESLKYPKVVPQLTLDSGASVFSSNAAAKYLYPPSPQEVDCVNYYLDLESAVIQPLATFFNTKVNEFVSKSFEEVLSELERELSSKVFLSGEKVTVADICVWSTLYPLFTDPKISKDLFKSDSFLKKWLEKIHHLQPVKEALKSYPASLGNVGSAQFVKASGASTTKSVPSAKVPTQESPVKESVAVSDEEKRSAASAWEVTVKKSPKHHVRPVLPIPGEKNILITSALPYVNNVPHLGNIIGCVLSGDVFARFSRLRGHNTLYICGTDEYGTATETKALQEKLTPQEICDKYFKTHDAIYKWFNISFDYFGRTTTPQQIEIVQEIFKKVYDNGYVKADSVKQLLCKKCDKYLADRFVEGTCPRCAYDDARGDQCDGCGHLINASELIKPRCKICQETPILCYSNQFFLDLPKIEPELKTWINESWSGWSHNAREISKAWLNDGLKPRCITRDLKWGIPVPVEGFQNKVFYVWFDAPIGYISITKLYTNEWKKWWMPEKDTQVSLYQFMAKDNVPFHSVMFPASLIATKDNYVLVNNIYATEYLNYENGKFSKSRGVGVFGNDAQDTGIPADIWRFYLLYVRPESQDSSFSWLDLAMKNNSELLNVLGNFINRTLVFCEKNYSCKVPEINLIEEDYEFLALVNRELADYISTVEKGKLREGVRHILAIARLGNQLMQASQIWVLCKGTDDDKKRCGTVIALCINLSCLLSQLLHPYMPETSNVIRKQLNSPPEVDVIEDKFRLLLPADHQIGKPFPLFSKIEVDHVEKLKAKFSGREKSETPPAGGDVGGKKGGKTKDTNQENKDAVGEAKNKEPTSQSAGASKTAEELEEEIKKQGDLVRQLKASGVDRSQWQPEVNALLALKKQLAEVKGEPMQTSSRGKSKKN